MMPAKGQHQDLTGLRFGRLVAVRFDHMEGAESCWLCHCDCGNERVVRMSNLKRGNTVSCGCYTREQTGNRRRTHGQRNTPLYKVWSSMKERCYYPKSISYKNYGARGITVCDEWRNDFVAFRDWSLSHGYSTDKKYQLDRIDNDLGYSPDNCRFITRRQQANNRRTSYYITYHGFTKTAIEWARFLGVSYKDLYKALKASNDDIEAAITNFPIRMKEWPDEPESYGERQLRTRHDKPKASLYNIWWNTRAQCCNPNYNRYQKYGAKGITIDPEWEESFEAFKQWAIRSGYEDGHSLMLKRHDLNGPFSPNNCYWKSRVKVPVE